MCSRGSEPITDAVPPGMTSPAPMPSRTMPKTVLPYVEVTVAPDICHSPPATISRPAATVSLVPANRTKTAEIGAITAIEAAAGSTRTPASSAE